jgi:hypothetical protein
VDHLDSADNFAIATRQYRAPEIRRSDIRDRGADLDVRRSPAMALNEAALSGATSVIAGTVYVVAGVVTVAPTSQTVAAWAAAIGGSPVIMNCDIADRTHSPSPFRAGGISPFD